MILIQTKINKAQIDKSEKWKGKIKQLIRQKHLKLCKTWGVREVSVEELYYIKF